MKTLCPIRCPEGDGKRRGTVEAVDPQDTFPHNAIGQET
jgi:hypothetical protein